MTNTKLELGTHGIFPVPVYIARRDLNLLAEVVGSDIAKETPDLTRVPELEEARERAESFSTGNSVNAIYSSHMADAGSDQQEREKLFYFLKRETEFLKCIDRAIEMMDEGIFGICKTCCFYYFF